MDRKRRQVLPLTIVMVLLLVLAAILFRTVSVQPERRETAVRTDEAQTAEPAQGGHVLYVDANDGVPLNGGDSRQSFPLDKNQLRTNTPLGQKLFARPGWVPLCWNTAPDGSGEDIPFGSRTSAPEGSVLYVRWLPQTQEEDLIWEERDGGACVTEYRGNDTVLALPERLGGIPVTVIAAGAFRDARIETAVLPPTLAVIEDGAFSGNSLQTLWLYDSLMQVSDGSFTGCGNLRTLYLGADTQPRYSSSYFAAFADKVDWLRANRGEKKLVLAGGSASRFAYNSQRLQQELPGWVPVNMGVYAYSNMLPQYRIMQQFMEAGDVLLSAPEFDTTQTQFCISKSFDSLFWAMMEADYANVSLLVLHQYDKVFDSLSVWLGIRSFMSEQSWLETPRHWDDDGNRVPYDTYNQYGDYTLVRPGASADKLLQHFRADYRVEAFPEDMISALNGVYREFWSQGVTVYFAYAPRNRSSLTEESNAAARRKLHAWMTEQLCVPILIDIEDSLYPGTYFYLIDSHLSGEGVYLHTRNIAQALKSVLPEQGAAVGLNN